MVKILRALGLIVLVGSLSVLTSCRKSSEDDKKLWTLEIDVKGADGADSIWYVHTYGATQVSVDTLTVTKKSRLVWENSWERDTIDLVILYDAEGKIVAPLFPMAGTRLARLERRKVGTPIKVEGVLNEELLSEWLDVTRNSDLPDSVRQRTIISILNDAAPFKIGGVLLAGLASRPDTTAFGVEIAQMSTRNMYSHRETMDIFGIDWRRFNAITDHQRRLSVPRTFPIMENKKSDKRLSVRRLAGRGDSVLIQFFTLHAADSTILDSLSKYLKHLDSLNVSYLTVLPETYTLPTEWKERFIGDKQKNAHYFIIDTTGEASTVVAQSGIYRLPTFFLVDTLGMVKYEWQHPDSVLRHFSRPEKQKK